MTRAALGVLAEGGNAFDAALAAGFAAAWAEPMFTSLGGGGFLLARSADGREVLFDFFVDTPGRGLGGAEALEPHFVPITVQFPASDQVFNIGRGSVAVPGTLAGFLHAHRRLGRLPIARVTAPAVALARDGIELNDHQAYVIGLLHPINTLSEAGRALYTPEGRNPEPGERLANPELASFIDALPGAAEDFYGGALARRVEADMRAGQGLLTAEDLAGYRVIEREPLRFDYRGHRLLTNPPPSFGGGLIALSLALSAAQGIRSVWGSPEQVCEVAASMVEVDRLREQAVLTPDALHRARASGGTTHISVADAEGNAASMTLSNGEGSGTLVPGTGIMLNNMLGEDDLHPEGFHADPPGQRVASMMSPSIVLRDGAVRLILGSGGSKRIRTALVQVIRAVIDFDQSIRDAVEAPRLHWDGEHLQLEPGLGRDAMAALREHWPVNAWDARNLYFGGVHAVDASTGEAAGDPRRGGHAATLG